MALPPYDASRPGTVVRGDEIPALTGLRFIAAFSVVIAHAASTLLGFAETPFGVVYWVRQASGFGMTLFFVLSGFVIHYNYANVVTGRGLSGIGTYLWARFARLYPLFGLMLVVYVLASSKFRRSLMGDSEALDALLTALPYFVLSIQSWIYLPVKGDALISAVGGSSPLTWSISTEWFFYFCYLLIAGCVLRARHPALLLLGLLLWCATWTALASSLFDARREIDAWAAAHFGAIAVSDHNLQDSFFRWLLYHSPYLRIGEFMLGCLIAQLYLRLRHRHVGRQEYRLAAALLVAAALSVPILTYLMYSPDADSRFIRKLDMNFGLAPSAALIIFCTARYSGPVARLLSTRPFLALGEASYSIYLIHYVVLVVVMRLSVEAAPTAANVAWAMLKVGLALTFIFVAALALYFWFEAPARKWLRGLWSQTPNNAGRAIALTLAVSPALLALAIVLTRPVILSSAPSLAGAAAIDCPAHTQDLQYGRGVAASCSGSSPVQISHGSTVR